MKMATFWIATLAVFGVANAMISQKEAAIRGGVTMYLELAPRDPRSLMQGDYMALRFPIGMTAASAVKDAPWRGRLIVRLDENNVARFVRIYDGEPLGASEHLLRYRLGRGEMHVGADSYFFQEGHAEHYAAARYGEFKVAPGGESVLVALRNRDFSKSGPPAE